MCRTVTRAPWSLAAAAPARDALLRRVAASGWDQRYASDPQRLVPLTAALDLLPAPPRRVLDVGTGTGAAALLVADRWPDAEVTGIDVAPAMIDAARAQGERSAASGSWSRTSRRSIPGEGYDLVIMLNMPPFFEQVAKLLRPGGHVVSIASRGATTPFFTPAGDAEAQVSSARARDRRRGTAGPGTYYLARRP